MSKKRGATQAQGETAQGTLDAKLLAYCAMAGGALLAAPPAEAAVVYSGVKNLWLYIIPTPSSRQLDLNGDGVYDMQIYGASSGDYGGGVGFIGLKCYYANSFIGGFIGEIRNSTHVAGPFNIASGYSITPALSWNRGTGWLNGLWRSGSTRATLGSFVNTTGYIGIKFAIGNNRHYGWIKYKGYLGGNLSSGTILGWAYESTPDYTIQAGQTTGSGNPPVDTDGDGTPDASDNCPTMYNYWQRDTDGDHIGDACDTTPGCGDAGQPYCEWFDTDADGIQNRLDNCPTVSNPRQPDSDADGIGDMCDPTPGCGTGCGQTPCG